MQPTMIPTIVSVVALLLPSIQGMCYSPMIHGLAPDVILPSVFSSQIYCPPPHVFDHLVCMCVDPSVERRAGLDLSLHLASTRQLGAPPSLRLVGLPDMHIPGRLGAWGAGGRYGYKTPGKAGDSVVVAQSEGRRGVPALNPYGSFNMPANSNALKAAAAARASLLDAGLASKQRDILDKVRWRQQLQRETAVAVAAAELAAASSALPGASSAMGMGAGGPPTLEGFMRDTLRRILYGY
ncbi:uncharacterized protein [Littorina saxatilis]|uniref:Uncharacterized protein n=1 Tax=Littorina saxatilis TaxID=31220 RepID=A0AAN9GHN0_9CAEN